MLCELEVNGLGVIVGDESGAADRINERLAPACEVVGIQRARGVAGYDEAESWANACASAALASCLALWATVQCLCSNLLRLGVR